MKFEIKPDIFDNFVDAICIISEDLRPVYFNPSFANLIDESSLALIRKKPLPELLQIDDFDWEKMKLGCKTLLEAPVREALFRTKSKDGRLQITWKSMKTSEEDFKVLIYLKDVSLEDVLNRKYHDEISRKEETIKALDQHLFQISLIRDVLERTTTFDDPLVMLRNLFAHLSGILNIDLAMYIKQETRNGALQLITYTTNNKLDLEQRTIRDLAENVKPHLIAGDLHYQKIDGYSWISFKYLDDSERQKYFIFAKKMEFSYNDENLLETICEPLSFSLDNRELFKKAMTDELTDLYNHRYFKVRLDNEIREHGERKKTFGLLLLDLDHFKKVNDTYGHLVGDIVLKVAAHCLKDFCRSTDVAARYGGEEFAVILPNIEESHVYLIGERLRESIESLIIPIPNQEKPLKITASIGLSVFPRNGKTTIDLIAAADEALYQVKNSGRNGALLSKKIAA